MYHIHNWNACGTPECPERRWRLTRKPTKMFAIEIGNLNCSENDRNDRCLCVLGICLQLSTYIRDAHSQALIEWRNLDDLCPVLMFDVYKGWTSIIWVLVRDLACIWPIYTSRNYVTCFIYARWFSARWMCVEITPLSSKQKTTASAHIHHDWLAALNFAINFLAPDHPEIFTKNQLNSVRQLTIRMGFANSKVTEIVFGKWSSSNFFNKR